MQDLDVHRYSPFTEDTEGWTGLIPACSCGWRVDRELIELGGYENAIDRFEEHVLTQHGVRRHARMI